MMSPIQAEPNMQVASPAIDSSMSVAPPKMPAKPSVKELVSQLIDALTSGPSEGADQTQSTAPKGKNDILKELVMMLIKMLIGDRGGEHADGPGGKHGHHGPKHGVEKRAAQGAPAMDGAGEGGATAPPRRAEAAAPRGGEVSLAASAAPAAPATPATNADPTTPSSPNAAAPQGGGASAVYYTTRPTATPAAPKAPVPAPATIAPTAPTTPAAPTAPSAQSVTKDITDYMKTLSPQSQVSVLFFAPGLEKGGTLNLAPVIAKGSEITPPRALQAMKISMMGSSELGAPRAPKDEMNKIVDMLNTLPPDQRAGALRQAMASSAVETYHVPPPPQKQSNKGGLAMDLVGGGTQTASTGASAPTNKPPTFNNLKQR
jgi:hypothetical protein